MSRPIFRPAAAGLFVVLLGAFGCGKSEKSQVTGASVSGLVRYQGKPVTGGAIRLWSENKESGGVSAAGVINGDGTYEVFNAPIGRCKVVVNTETVKHDRSALMQRIPEKDRAQVSAAQKVSPKKYMPIDPKYTDLKTTPTEITVENGRQTHDIDLP